jgi:hypothetical protein
MSRDEIIKLAREACDPGTVDAWKNGFWTLTQEELERFAALVAKAEREACAKLAESLPMQQEIDVRDQCAAAIRARGEK